MAIIYNLGYQRISFIYILYITSINYLSCNEDINASFSIIYKKIHYLSDNKELNFITHDSNNICVKNNGISNLLKQNYSSNDEKYLCLYNRAIYILINKNLFEQWFNLIDYLNYSKPDYEKYYYDLTIYKTEDNIINFIVGFVKDRKIYFLLCKKKFK